MKPPTAEPDRRVTVLRFAPDHPVGAGHFPDDPIIPGALLLDHVLRALAVVAPVDIRQVKFLRPVRPGDWVTIVWERREDGEIRFECQHAGEVACTGTVKAAGQ